MIWHLAHSNIENRNRSTTLNFTGDLNVIADGDHGDGDGDGEVKLTPLWNSRETLLASSLSTVAPPKDGDLNICRSRHICHVYEDGVHLNIVSSCLVQGGDPTVALDQEGLVPGKVIIYQAGHISELICESYL